MDELFLDSVSKEKYYKCKPQSFFRFFREISSIPRSSGNEDRIASYLCGFARCRGLDIRRDAQNNVLIYVPATPGYENQPSILLQCHTDMVCMKDENLKFDFETMPLKFKMEGDKLSACGTTLGADNGKGIATLLAIADDAGISHPPLELLFTAKEEIGLIGIRNFDLSLIKSRRMINLDCGNSHTICVSSSGIIKAFSDVNFMQERISDNETALSLTIDGGLGGHSGMMINSGRACVACVLNELFLSLTYNNINFGLVSIKTSDVAIIKYVKAVFSVNNSDVVAAKNIILSKFSKVKDKFSGTDPDLNLEISNENADFAASLKDTAGFLKLISCFKTGPVRFGEKDDSVITSGAINSISFCDGKGRISYSIRSFVDDEMKKLFELKKLDVERLGFNLLKEDEYCGWQENENSVLRKKFNKLHNELFEREIKIQKLHGSVETGIIVSGISSMDAVGFTTSSFGAHTTSECLFTAKLKSFWKLILAVLADKD